MLSLRPALVTNSLCLAPEKRTMRETAAPIGNFGIIWTDLAKRRAHFDFGSRGLEGRARWLALYKNYLMQS